MPTWMRTNEACEHLRCKRTTLYVMMSAGRLPFYKMQGLVLFRKEDLDAMPRLVTTPKTSVAPQINKEETSEPVGGRKESEQKENVSDVLMERYNAKARALDKRLVAAKHNLRDQLQRMSHLANIANKIDTRCGRCGTIKPVDQMDVRDDQFFCHGCAAQCAAQGSKEGSNGA